MQTRSAAHYLDGQQIESVLDKLVPLIAAPEDHGVFRFVLRHQAMTMNSSSFAVFVARLLKSTTQEN